MRYRFIVGFLVVMFFVVAPRPAAAIPVFARMYKLPCSTCHSPGPPMLNEFGKNFKEHGYYMPGGAEFSPNELLTMSELPPVAVELKSWLISHQKSQPKAQRTQFIIPQTAEILVGSPLGPTFSLFGEMEIQHGEGASVGNLIMDWHAKKDKVSVRAGHFQPDEWLALSLGSGNRRMTRQGYEFEEHAPPGLDGVQAIDDETAGFMVYGRPATPLWVDVAVLEGDTANSQKDFWGHASVNVVKKARVDVFGYAGKVGDMPTKYSRMGAGVFVPVKKATASGAWSAESFAKAGDQGADAKYSTGFVGFIYPFTERTYVDAHWDFITSSHITPKENKNFTTVQLGYLIRLNVRTAVEYTVDSKDSKNNVFTWLLHMAT